MIIDPDADRPAYRQLADALRARIEAGELRPGWPLPAEQTLIGEYGVSRATVRRAVEDLREEGLVVTRPRYGTYVRDQEHRHVVLLTDGDVWARPATRREARRYRVATGAPMLVVQRGGTEIVVPADRVRVKIIRGTDHRR